MPSPSYVTTGDDPYPATRRSAVGSGGAELVEPAYRKASRATSSPRLLSAETWKSPNRVFSGYGPYEPMRGSRRIASAAMMALMALRGV